MILNFVGDELRPLRRVLSFSPATLFMYPGGEEQPARKKYYPTLGGWRFFFRDVRKPCRDTIPIVYADENAVEKKVNRELGVQECATDDARRTSDWIKKEKIKIIWF